MTYDILYTSKHEIFSALGSIPGQFNPLNFELNPIWHLLTLLAHLLAHHILHISRIRVNVEFIVENVGLA